MPEQAACATASGGGQVNERVPSARDTVPASKGGEHDREVEHGDQPSDQREDEREEDHENSWRREDSLAGRKTSEKGDRVVLDHVGPASCVHHSQTTA